MTDRDHVEMIYCAATAAVAGRARQRTILTITVASGAEGRIQASSRSGRSGRTRCTKLNLAQHCIIDYHVLISKFSEKNGYSIDRAID